jgi:hypothetical protein
MGREAVLLKPFVAVAAVLVCAQAALAQPVPITQRHAYEGQRRPAAELATVFGKILTMPLASAPIPKFASYRGEFVCELRNRRSTSNFMILVRLLNLKFLNECAAI